MRLLNTLRRLPVWGQTPFCSKLDNLLKNCTSIFIVAFWMQCLLLFQSPLLPIACASPQQLLDVWEGTWCTGPSSGSSHSNETGLIFFLDDSVFVCVFQPAHMLVWQTDEHKTASTLIPTWLFTMTQILSGILEKDKKEMAKHWNGCAINKPFNLKLFV